MDELTLTDLTGGASDTITYSACHSQYPGTKLFDNSFSDISGRYLGTWNASSGAWVQYEFAEKTVVNGYMMMNADSTNGGYDTDKRSPRSWKFEALDDNGNWITLDTQQEQPEWANSEKRSFGFLNTTAYQTYRLHVTELNGATDYLQLWEMEFYNVLSEPNTLVVVGVPDSFVPVSPAFGAHTVAAGACMVSSPATYTWSLLKRTYTCTGYRRFSVMEGESSGTQNEISFTQQEGDSSFLIWNYSVEQIPLGEEGVVLYVGPDGEDENNSGEAENVPLATIKKALEILPNETPATIYVLPGTYNETNIMISEPVRILGYTGNPEDVVFEYNSGSDWDGSYRTFQVLHADVVIANLTVDKAFGGQVSANSSPSYATSVDLTGGGTLSNCVIHASSFKHPYRRGGVWVKHAKARVTRCLFMENSIGGGEGDWWYPGFASGSSIYQTLGLVDNCVFIRNSTQKATNYPWTSTVVMEGGSLANCSFFENTGNKAGAIYAEETNARVYNTVFYGNAIVEGSKTPEQVYNDSYAGVAQNFVNCAADEETMLGTGGIPNLTDAAFKDYANGKYVPAGGGVLYNAGTTENVPDEALVLDFAGNPRKRGSKVDIGAFEAPEAGLRILIR